MATDRNRIAEIALRVKTDSGSVQRAQRDLDGLRKSIKGIGDAGADVKRTDSALRQFATSGGSQKIQRAFSGLGLGGLGDLFGVIDDIGDVSETASKQAKGLNSVILGLGVAGVTASAGVALITAAIDKIREAAKPAEEQLRQQLTAADLYYDTINGVISVEDAKKRLAELKAIQASELDQARAADLNIRARFEQNQQLFGDFAARIGDQLTEQDDILKKEFDDATLKAYEAGQSIDALNKALAQLPPTNEEVINTEKELADARLKAATEDGQRILAENEKVFAAIARQNEQLASAYQKYEQDIADLQDTYQQDRIQAEKDYQQTLVDIADAAAKAAEDALARLTEKRDQLAADFAQGELDAQRQLELDRQQIIIDAQRQEAQAYRDHQRNLRDIQIEAARERERLAEDRDFAGLFDLERQTSQRMEDANRAFEDERSDRQMALEQERIDLLASYEIERQQRFEQYQRNLVDAQAQYQRELMLAERNRREALTRAQQAYSAELVMLYQKLQTEMEARRTAAIAEITLINQTEQQKLAIIEQYAIAARNFLASTFAPVTAPASNSTSVAYTQNVNVSGAGFGPGINGVIRNVTRGVLQEFLT